MNGATAYIAAIGYVLFLFLIAWWGDRGGRRFLAGRKRALVYALSLAVYCTSWTYYGSVGLASSHGLDFLPIYIGPILVIGLGSAFVGRIANLARDAEPDHRRRLRLGALRQVSGGRRGCGADRAGRLGALCRAPAQGGLDHAPDCRRFARQIAADARTSPRPCSRSRSRWCLPPSRSRSAPAASIPRSTRTA